MRVVRFLGRAALSAAGGLVIIGAVAWFAAPLRMARALIQANNVSAGLSARTIATDTGVIHYLEGGTGETVLLVHGIYARKEHWVEVARALVKDYRVIAIDLPGFGDNAKLPEDQYLLNAQRDNLVSVMGALDLGAVHVGANSMGAYVATLVAEQHPEMFKSLSYIGSPLGVPTLTPSDMDTALASGQRPLVVQTNDDFFARNDWLAPIMPYVPGPILKSWSADEVATAEHNSRIWDVVHTESVAATVLDIAPALNMPSIVLWCAQDRIFHVSGAQLLGQALPNAQVTTLDNCGHVPMLDQPKTVASAYLAFLASFADAAD